MVSTLPQQEVPIATCLDDDDQLNQPSQEPESLKEPKARRLSSGLSGLLSRSRTQTFSMDEPSPEKGYSSVSCAVMCAYVVALALSWGVYDIVAGRRWTSILTLSSIAHCLGLVLLGIKMISQQSAAGISARALLLEGLAVGMRLCSTLLYHGYLPADQSGDYVYQLFDLLALALIVFLLQSVLITNRSTYQEIDDDMPVHYLVIGSIILAIFFYADLNDEPLFDIIWMAGLLVSVTAVLPQLWLVTKTSGEVQSLTAHYIALTAIDRILSGMFMWFNRKYISCAPWAGDFEHAVYAILLAHIIHLLLLSDFAYKYIRARVVREDSGPSLEDMYG